MRSIWGVDDASERKSKKINHRARPAAYRNSRASLCRRGSGSAGMQANQAGVSGGGFCAGVRERRYRAADPLHHAYHPGEPPAADRAQAIAESQPTTRGGLQSGQSEVRQGRLPGVLAQPLPANPQPGSVQPDYQPAPAHGDRVQFAPVHEAQNAPLPSAQTVPEQGALVSALPPEDRPETGPAKPLPPQFRRVTIEYASKEP